MPYPSSPYLYPGAFGAYPSYTDPDIDPPPPPPPPGPTFPDPSGDVAPGTAPRPDVDIVGRGSGFTISADVTATVSVVLPSDLELDDFIVVIGSVDFNSPPNPASPSCPVVASWSEIGWANDADSEQLRAWLGKVTTAPTTTADCTVSLSRTEPSGLHVAARGFSAGGEDIVVDGAATTITDRSSPYTHLSATPGGTKDLLVVAHGAVQFSGTLAYGTAPAGMTAWAHHYNQYSGLQVCTQTLTSAAATGTRDQVSNIATLAGGAGIRFLLRAQGPPAVLLRDTPRAWQWILGPASGGWKWELANAKARKASFKLRDNSTASFSIRGEDPMAEHIEEFSTDLHLLRRNRAGVVEQLYRGRVAPTNDELTDAGHMVSVPSLDYGAVLERRILASGSQVTWTTQDRYTIAFGLITQAQNKVGGDYGISNDAGLAGKTATMTFELGDSVGQKLREFSESETGFDWEILPVGPSGLSFTAWGERGTSRGVVLQWGGALVSSITRTVPDEYANMVRVSGQPPEGSSTPPATHEGTALDIATAPQGRWDRSFGTSITTTAAVSDRKDWLLDYHQVVRPSYTIKLKPRVWDGPSHIWLGDPVRLVIVSGKRLRVDTSLRVQQIDVDISDDGEEAVSLTVGAPRPDFARRTAANEKRLDELERR